MDEIITIEQYRLCYISAAFAIIAGVVLLIINFSLKRRDGKSLLPLIIIGWTLLALAITELFVSTLLFVIGSSGTFGLFLVMALGGIFILTGVAVLLGTGISSLVEGCKKDEQGKRNKETIVRGAALLFLAIAVAVTIIVTIAVMLYIESNKEKPVRFMVSLLWIVKYLIAF